MPQSLRLSAAEAEERKKMDQKEVIVGGRSMELLWRTSSCMQTQRCSELLSQRKLLSLYLLTTGPSLWQEGASLQAWLKQRPESGCEFAATFVALIGMRFSTL
eukprot:6460032-Amphidinium_carterae.1